MRQFNLTDIRLAEVKRLLGKQYSMTYVANEIGCTQEVLSYKLKELKLNPKELKREGLNTFKADAMAIVDDIEEPKDKFKAALDFLKHYDKSDDVAETKIELRQGVGDLYKVMND